MYVTHHLAMVMERTCLTCSGSRGRSGTYVLSAHLYRAEPSPESPTGNLGIVCVTKNESSPGGTLSHATGHILELSDYLQILLPLERIKYGCFPHYLCFLAVQWVLHSTCCYGGCSEENSTNPALQKSN